MTIEIMVPRKIFTILIGLRFLVTILKDKIGRPIKIAEIGPLVKKPAERDSQKISCRHISANLVLYRFLYNK